MTDPATLRDLARRAKEIRLAIQSLGQSILRDGPIDLYSHIVDGERALGTIQRGLISAAHKAGGAAPVVLLIPSFLLSLGGAM